MEPLETPGRAWFALTAAAALFGIVVDVAVAATSDGAFPGGWNNALNTFTYFTVMSNIFVLLTSALLALRNKTSAILHLDALVCIIVTAVVYHLMLAGADNPTGWGAIGNLFTHSLVPALMTIGWLGFGPRRLFTKRTILPSLVVPMIWLIFTLIRGALTNYYPYDFINVPTLGYGEVAATSAVITGVFVLLAACAVLIDRRISRS